MSTTNGTTWLERTPVSTRHVSSFIWKYWNAFRERCERRKLLVTLSSLSDTELMDIGITRSEIDYVASRPARHPIRRMAIPANGGRPDLPPDFRQGSKPGTL
jgi:uncharacterized protein YjiS (DUF1127 family)